MDLIYGDVEAWLSARFARLTMEETGLLLQGLDLLRIAFLKP
jgi:hypothetical protein